MAQQHPWPSTPARKQTARPRLGSKELRKKYQIFTFNSDHSFLPFTTREWTSFFVCVSALSLPRPARSFFLAHYLRTRQISLIFRCVSLQCGIGRVFLVWARGKNFFCLFRLYFLASKKKRARRRCGKWREKTGERNNRAKGVYAELYRKQFSAGGIEQNDSSIVWGVGVGTLSRLFFLSFCHSVWWPTLPFSSRSAGQRIEEPWQ